MTNSTSVGRGRLRARRAVLALSTVLCSGLAAPAFAQDVPPAPVRQSVDANGVDLFLGAYTVAATPLTIGQGDTTLSYQPLNKGNGWSDNVRATLDIAGTKITVRLGGVSDSFTMSGNTYTPTEGNGATLSFDSGGKVYTYVRGDGTVIHFDQTISNAFRQYQNAGAVTDIVDPSGRKLTFSYDTTRYCSRTKQLGDEQVCIVHGTAYRLARARNSFGYQLAFLYATDTVDPDDTDVSQWLYQTGVSATNLAVAAGGSLPSLTTSYAVSGSTTYYTVTDAANRTTKYRFNGPAVGGVTLPGSTAEDITVAYASGKVASVATPAGSTSYTYVDQNGERTTTVTDALSHSTTYVFDIASARMTSMTDALQHATSWQYDASGRPTRITRPELDDTELHYDDRGNVTQQRRVAKPGSGFDDIVTSATYAATCANPVTCNQPLTTTDARGHVTEYGYDATSGDVVVVAAPAPTAGAARPRTKYRYTSLQAYFRNAAGSIVASGEPVARLTGVSICRTDASCAGTADETVTTTDYGPQSAGTGNNLLPVAVTVAAGDGSLGSSTAAAYDDIGNVVALDGPLPGSADTTTLRYDAARQLVGTVAADPDGAGPRARAALRYSYDDRGRRWRAAAGTVSDASDTAWYAFSEAYHRSSQYDAAGRIARATFGANGTDDAVADYRYDPLGRRTCAITYMDPAVWGPQATACTPLQTGGPAGPDRVVRTTYDAVGRATLVESGVGTPAQANDAAASYNANGTVSSLTDANGNVTTYGYDGFDRLYRTYYPLPAVGAGTSSASDYEQLDYDLSGNVVARRLRDGRSIAYGYDDLDRLVSKDLPDGTATDVGYAYDLTGALTSASFPASGEAVTFAYDALGRVASSTSTMGGTPRTVGYGYDAAGNRTLLTHPDGVWFGYDYDALGRMTQATGHAASGAVPFYTVAYDDLGRRGAVSLGGSGIGYGYDAASRLTSLTHTFADATLNTTSTFAYNAAGQIAGMTRSNDAYAYAGSANRDETVEINGLNQASTGNGVFYYDTLGNAKDTGAAGVVYDAENRLVSAGSFRNPSAFLRYDPLGRLWSMTGSASGNVTFAPRQFLYDGDQIIAEYNYGTLTDRYAYGAGVDEPVLWDSGSALDCSGTKLLHADERGSVVASADCAGNGLGVNTYDENGVPGRANTGRFQYTGQAWLAPFGVYDYKARMYAPYLAGGRFLQTDPIGYGDGLNWYGYVHGDPINRTDPSGLTVGLQPATTPDGADIIVNGVLIKGSPGGTPSDGRPHCGAFTATDELSDGQCLDAARPGVQQVAVGTGTPQNDIVVTAKKYAKRLGQCVAAQYGFGDGSVSAGLDLGKIASEIGGIPLPKRLLGIPLAGGEGVSKFTNLISYVPFKLGIRANTGLQILGSGRVFGVLGRLNAPVAAALAAYDAASIAICTAGE